MDSKKEINNCSCKNYTEYLWIDRSKTTQLAACMVLAAVCIFGAGFFLGKRKALDTLTEDLQQQAFSDQLHHSVLQLYGKPSYETDTDNEAAAEHTDNGVQNSTLPVSADEQYYIQIVKPYYVLETAQRLCARLQKKGIPSTLVKRESRQQSTNKKIPWYQIQTQTYDNEDEVENVINIIKTIDSTLRVAKLKK